MIALKAFLALMCLIVFVRPDIDLSQYDATQFYYGGTILTDNPDRPEAEAAIVADGNVVIFGTVSRLKRYVHINTDEIDLCGRRVTLDELTDLGE